MQGRYQTLNYGICGATAQTSGDCPYLATDFLKAGLEKLPEVVILMLGTNDSKPYNWNASNYEKDLSGIVEITVE